MQNGQQHNSYFPPPRCRRCHSYDEDLRLIDTMLTIDDKLQIAILNTYECADRIACTIRIEEQEAAIKQEDLEHLYQKDALPGATKPKRNYILDERSPVNGQRKTTSPGRTGCKNNSGPVKNGHHRQR